MTNPINNYHTNAGFNSPKNNNNDETYIQRFERTFGPIPTHNIGRAPNDHRSAEQISESPLFSALKRLPEHMRRQFYERVGGSWNKPNPHSLQLTDTPHALEKNLDHHRASNAANAERVLQYIDRCSGPQSTHNNQKIEGFGIRILLDQALNKNNYTYPHSEAWYLYNFIEKGYAGLPKPPHPPKLLSDA